MSDVAIVILNWNGRHFLQKFLPGVIANSRLNNRIVEIIIADNASTDGSIEYLTHNFPNVRLIQFNENHGFAKGYDLALKQIEATYFVLLNSDVETPANWLSPLYEFMESEPSVAVTMPKLKLQKDKRYFEYAGAAGGFIDKYGYTFCQGRIFNNIEIDNGQYDEKKEIFWATGACFMIRSNVYFEAGGLDHRFFAHMEEIDLCWRIRNSGYNIYYLPESEVYHVGGGTLPETSPYKTYLNFRNNLILLYKNLPGNNLYFNIITRLCLDFIAAVHMITKGSFKNVIAIFRAHWSFYGLLRSLRNEGGSNYGLIKSKTLVYQKSIVISYFLRNKKTFKSLSM